MDMDKPSLFSRKIEDSKPNQNRINLSRHEDFLMQIGLIMNDPTLTNQTKRKNVVRIMNLWLTGFKNQQAQANQAAMLEAGKIPDNGRPPNM